ncbi:MAG: ABC transporter permease [Anaerolineae bacterium]|nr:ABC transporter permease [Anaerolineae bacterium]
MLWRAVRRSPLGLLGLTLLTLIVVMAVGASWIAPYNPTQTVGKPLEAPSAAHWLGTNDIGQDILSELIFGARISLLIGVLSAAIALVIGTGVGLMAGYFRGLVGALLMRLVDVVLVIPFLPLMVLLAAYLGQNIWNLIAVIGLLIWARPARVIRSQVLSLAERDYVLAARAVGARDGHILIRHVLPGVFSLALAQFVLATSGSILLEAALSFLGLGDPTQKSWGTILYYAQARNAFLSGAWRWWVIPPGIMITLSVLGFALLGFALEEALNPRLKGRGATAEWRASQGHGSPGLGGRLKRLFTHPTSQPGSAPDVG